MGPSEPDAGGVATDRGAGLHLLGERYGTVLLVLLGAYLLTGVGENPATRSLFIGLFLGILALALLSPGLAAGLRRAGLVATCALGILIVSLSVVDQTDAILGAVFLVAFFAQLLAIVALLERIARHLRVTRQTVFGGIAAYTMIGFACASLFRALDLLTGDQLLSTAVESGDYIYFSFVTLTTLGFGDLTPVTALGQRLVVVEALVGQLFLVTLVARLVSLWGQPADPPTGG